MNRLLSSISGLLLGTILGWSLCTILASGVSDDVMVLLENQWITDAVEDLYVVQDLNDTGREQLADKIAQKVIGRVRFAVNQDHTRIFEESLMELIREMKESSESLLLSESTREELMRLSDELSKLHAKG